VKSIFREPAETGDVLAMQILLQRSILFGHSSLDDEQIRVLVILLKEMFLLGHALAALLLSYRCWS
jgi:hypothetical protein